MKLSCLVNCTLLPLGEGPGRDVSLFADFEPLTCIQMIITRADWFSLASMFKVVSVPSFHCLDHYWSEFGFRISQNENIGSSQSKLFCFLSSIFLTLIWCLPTPPPFFFFLNEAAIPQLFHCFRGFQAPCSLGVSLVAPPRLLVAALCFVLAQLNVQLCGELIQLKNNLAEKSDATAPECETSASGFARGGWRVVM